MRSFCKTLFTSMALLVVASASAAAQRTYVAHRTVGTGFADLSITTDGTIGALGSANVTTWNIFISNGGFSTTLIGPGVGHNSLLGIVAPSLFATNTNLFFDFGAGSYGFALFQNFNNGEFYCLDISGCAGLGESLSTQSYLFPTNTLHQGVQTIASVQVSVVPEPATFVLLTAGLGAIGLVARRRRSAVKPYSSKPL